MKLDTIHTRSVKIRRDCSKIISVCDAYDKIPIKSRTPKVTEEFLRTALYSIKYIVENRIVPKAKQIESDIEETYAKLNSLKNERKKDGRTDKGNAK